MSRLAANVTTLAEPTILSTDGGVEESKANEVPGGTIEDVMNVAVSGEEMDEWVLATANAPAGGVRILDAPLKTARVTWRLLSGQIARLFPRLPGGKTSAGSEWRQAGGAGGEPGWLHLPVERCSEGPGSTPALEHFWTDRCLLDGFSPELTRRAAGTGGGDGVAADAGTSPIAENFWLPLKQQGSRETRVDEAAAKGRSHLSAAPLQGDSDALLLSAVDVGAVRVGDRSERTTGDARPLVVTGKWTIGLVTDTLTVTTRTSGCTRIVPSFHAEEDAPAALAALDGAATGVSDQRPDPLPVLVDGLVFGFRAADGLLVVTRALARADLVDKGNGAAAGHMEPVERRAVAFLGGVHEGAEVSFSIVDSGEGVIFSCREVGGRRRSATVRAKCTDTWGRGRVALGTRMRAQNSTTGWVRVVSQAHGATVRSGMSIDADGVVGRIPCGSVVPYDNAIVYHSPGASDRGFIDPVVRYRCIATATTPAGWISERGRYAEHPFRICERVRARPQQPAHLISHVSVACVRAPRAVGAAPPAERCELSSTLSFLPAREKARHGGGSTLCGDGNESGDWGWQRRLDEVSVLSARFRLLQQLNRGVWQALRYVDLSQGDLPGSMATLLSRCRHLIFSTLKQDLWLAELARTARPSSPQVALEGAPPTLELRLSRGRAARHVSSRRQRADQERRQMHTLFGQAFLALKHAPTEAFRLRPGEALYNTVFLGEHAHDAGGEAGLAQDC